MRGAGQRSTTGDIGDASQDSVPMPCMEDRRGVSTFMCMALQLRNEPLKSNKSGSNSGSVIYKLSGFGQVTSYP